MYVFTWRKIVAWGLLLTFKDCQTYLRVQASALAICQFDRPMTPPTIKNWKRTLHNLLLLQTVLRKHGFTCFRPRFLNQDPLENFFGQIRQRGHPFVNPTCSAFGLFYKSLLVNNLVSKHSLGSNCEDDKLSILVPLQNFIQQVRYVKQDTFAISITFEFDTPRGALRPPRFRLRLSARNSPQCNLYNILPPDVKDLSSLRKYEDATTKITNL
ncbi:hypothetical protein NQ315_003296 [Exocentrus adspersus]|uniref:Transposable element P transposase-like RNase H C-terminal domain-containing protein n=1 Tax=Exocentrus adspersus TaxID=1586481 RepID=A0AAV8VAQ1_9CUCU|nr:hypothetical protein NQ315_003296 [Exocentrus adspersus]